MEINICHLSRTCQYSSSKCVQYVVTTIILLLFCNTVECQTKINKGTACRIMAMLCLLLNRNATTMHATFENSGLWGSWRETLALQAKMRETMKVVLLRS